MVKILVRGMSNIRLRAFLIQGVQYGIGKRIIAIANE
jgi:hypothetical protein